MTRRGILAGLLALPFVSPIARAAKAIKRKLFPVVYVGAKYPQVFDGESFSPNTQTLAEAMKMVEPGGTIYLVPGHSETFTGTLDIGEAGLIAGIKRYP